MNDSVIHDSGFAGSPVMAYGQAPARRSFPKLLALLAGSFVVCLSALSVWFWFFSSMPIPKETVILAVVPSSAKLPIGVPEIWTKTKEANSPLPVVLGLSRVDGELIPFAVRVFGLQDFDSEGGLKAWHLISLDALATELSTPYRQFGWPGGEDVALTIKPGKLLGQEQGLPEIWSGKIKNRVWTIKNGSTNVISPSNAAVGTNFVPLGGSGVFASNLMLSQGIQSILPEEGTLAWEFEPSRLRVSILPQYMDTSTYMGLMASQGIFGERAGLLPDETDLSIQVVSTSSSMPLADLQEPVDISLPWIGLMSNKSNSTGMQCPGKQVAFFDETSLKNICTWVDICYVKLKRMAVNESENELVICYE